MAEIVVVVARIARRSPPAVRVRYWKVNLSS